MTYARPASVGQTFVSDSGRRAEAFLPPESARFDLQPNEPLGGG